MHLRMRNTKVLSGSQVFLENKRYCDFSVMAEEKVFHCHKIFLAAYSDYFEAMFRTDMLEANCSDAPVTLHGVCAEDFDIILKYIYMGEVRIDSGAVPRLFTTASYLEINAIKTECLQHMRERSFKLKSDSKLILQLRKLAVLEQDSDLLLTINRCLEDNFEKIAKLPEIKEMSLSSFSDFILECQTFFKSEEWLLRGAVVWCNQQELENRAPFLEFVSGLVNFDKISTVFLKHCCKDEMLLRESDSFHDVIRERYYGLRDHLATEKECANSHCAKVTAFYSESLFAHHHSENNVCASIGRATLEDRTWKPDYDLPVLGRSYLTDDAIQFAFRRGKLYELSVPNRNNFEKARLNACRDDEWNGVNLPEHIALGFPKMANSRNIGLIFSANSGQDYTQFYHYDEILDKFYLFSHSKMSCKVISMVCDANRVFVFGEESTYETITTWSYDLRAGFWFRVPSMLKLRNAVAADVCENELFVCNAYGAIRPGACDFELYDEVAAKWRSLPEPDDQQWPAGRNFVSTLGRATFGVFPSGAAGLHATFNASTDAWAYERLDKSKIPGCTSGKVIIAMDNTN